MALSTIGARLASATLLSALALAAPGVGTAAAASRNTHPSISIAATPAATAQVKVGTSFTDTFVITNSGDGSARDLKLDLMYNPNAVQVQGVQFNRTGAWVMDNTAGDVAAALGLIGSDGDSVSMTVNFVALPGYQAGSALQAQIESTWRDASDKNHSAVFSEPLISDASGQSSVIPTVPTSGPSSLSATGLQPNEAVTFWYNLPDGTAAPLYARDGKLTTEKTHANNNSSKSDVRNASVLYADENGNLTTSLTAGDIASGTYSLVIHGTASGVNVVIPFSI